MFIGLPELGPAQRVPLDPDLAHAMNVIQRALTPLLRQDMDRASAAGREMKRLATDNGMNVVPEPKTLSFLIVDPQTGDSRKIKFSEMKAGRTAAAKVQSLLSERRRRNHGE